MLNHRFRSIFLSLAASAVLLAALIFGLIGRFGDLPKLLGALGPEEK
jgi:hypothetical protein